MAHRMKYEYAFDSRISRALSQRIYLIDSKKVDLPHDKRGFEFQIMGNSGKAYNIQFAEKGAVSCSCPDHAVSQNLCKHLIFSMIRVLEDTKENVFTNYYMPLVCPVGGDDNGDPQVLIPFKVTDETIDKCKFYIENREAIAAENNEKRKELTDEDSCPICLEPMLEEGNILEALLWCKGQCGNSVHQSCFMKWVNKKASATCVLCRSQWVWN